MPKVKRPATGSEAVIGLDLGGTKLASALFDADGQVILKRQLPLERAQGTRLASSL